MCRKQSASSSLTLRGSRNTDMETNIILFGDALTELRKLPDECIDCIVTSPPYWGLRSYGIGSENGEIGQEKSLKIFLDSLLLITKELHRVLRKEGTLFWNHGDSYGGTGSKGSYRDPKYPKGRNGQSVSLSAGFMEKCLLLQAHRLVIRMIDEQDWILRNQVIWHKPNVMPSSAKDRFTVDFEPVFFFVKSKKYHFEAQYEPLSEVSIERVKYGWKSKKANASYKGRTTGIAVEEMGDRFANPRGRNKRTVWKISTSNSREEHVAMFPEKLIEPMVLAGCPRGGVVLDPFMGAGTTALVAKKLGRQYIGIEMNPAHIKIAEERIRKVQPSLF